MQMKSNTGLYACCFQAFKLPNPIYSKICYLQTYSLYRIKLFAVGMCGNTLQTFNLIRV